MRNYKCLVFNFLVLFIIISCIVSYNEAAVIPSPPSNLSISQQPASSPPIIVQPPGNDSLLSGKTPEKLSLPSGWTLIKAQGFEKGVLETGEWLGPGNDVSKTKTHSGNYAIRGYYFRDAAELKWGMSGETPTGKYTELYISFYEFTEPQARFHTEYIFGSNTKSYGNGYHRVNFNYFNAKGWNGTVAPYIIQGEGTAMGAYAWYGPYMTIPTGRWVQREIWHRPNTPNNSDGFIRFYEDGHLVQSRENANTNGPVDMRAGSWFMVGGVYTVHVWRLPDGSCSDYPGEGSGYDRETNWDACACPNQCPPDGKIPKFYRFIDDIIIMKR